MIIDAKDSILGRLCTVIAKKALAGEEVVVINCEKAVVTGKKNSIIREHMKRFELGQPQQGPFYPRRADQLVRRVIRGMLPWKRSRGRDAYRKVKCFIDVPDEVDKAKVEQIDAANISNSSTINFITVKELCRLIGK